MEQTLTEYRRMRRKDYDLRSFTFDVSNDEQLLSMIDESFRLCVVVHYVTNDSYHRDYYPIFHLRRALLRFYRALYTSKSLGLSVDVHLELCSEDMFRSKIIMQDRVCVYNR